MMPFTIVLYHSGDVKISFVLSTRTLKWTKSNGDLHRVGGPAVIWEDGSMFWYQNGQPHRDNDLPAFILFSGAKEWWVNGERYRSGNKPAIVHDDSMLEWWECGNLHREDGKSAVIYQDGYAEWWKNGKKIK